jgi:hypothetical protein
MLERLRHPRVCERVPAGRRLVGVEAVIDKDLSSGLLAVDLEADVLAIVTDVDAATPGCGTPAEPASVYPASPQSGLGGTCDSLYFRGVRRPCPATPPTADGSGWYPGRHYIRASLDGVSKTNKEPTQKTPKGLEIPVPTRESIFTALRKVIKPVKKP